MNEYIKKYYFYFIDDKDKNTLKEVKKYCKQNNIDFEKLTNKITRSVAKLKFELTSLGYDLSLDGFNIMLADYIEKKSTLKDQEKKRFLKILVNLSKIYDIDLRNELLKNEPTTKEEPTKEHDIEYLNKLIEEYNTKRNKLTDEEKSKYLKEMYELSKIHNIDIKDKLTIKTKLPKIKLNITNPLDNTDYLKELLTERYNSGSFDLHNTHSTKYINSTENEYDQLQDRVELINYLLNTYLGKITNYASIDIVEEYQKLLNDPDIEFINNMKIDNLTLYIKSLLSNKEPDIPKNVITLLKELINITDYNTSIGEKNIFNNQSSKSEYAIYINTPNNKETYTLINDYIKECINNNLNYDSRPYDEIEKTILYSSKEDLNTKLNILNNIISKINTKEFGTPVEYTGLINNSIYSISNIEYNNLNYYDYITELLEVSYYSVLSNIIIDKIDSPQDKTIIDNFINLNNITFDGNKTPLNIICNKNNFSTIKDTVHKSLPEVITSLQELFTNDNELNKLTKSFKQSIQYIYNITMDIDKDTKSNISTNINK